MKPKTAVRPNASASETDESTGSWLASLTPEETSKLRVLWSRRVETPQQEAGMVALEHDLRRQFAAEPPHASAEMPALSALIYAYGDACEALAKIAEDEGPEYDAAFAGVEQAESAIYAFIDRLRAAARVSGYYDAQRGEMPPLPPPSDNKNALARMSSIIVDAMMGY